MWETIDALRQKPKTTRNQVAFLVAFAVTVLVAGAWSLTLPSRMSSLLPQATSSVATVSEAPSIWSSVASFPASLRQLFTNPTGTVVVEKERTTPIEDEQSTGVWSAQSTNQVMERSHSETDDRTVIIIATTSSAAATTTLE